MSKFRLFISQLGGLAMKKLKEIDWLAIITENKKFSLGRISFWVTFVVMVHFWLSTIEVPASMLTVFFALLSYNLGKKVRDVVQLWMTKEEATSGP